MVACRTSGVDTGGPVDALSTHTGAAMFLTVQASRKPWSEGAGSPWPAVVRCLVQASYNTTHDLGRIRPRGVPETSAQGDGPGTLPRSKAARELVESELGESREVFATDLRSVKRSGRGGTQT